MDHKFSVIRDPVHGDIYLTQEELDLLDTADMQRLRGVRQLGTAYLVYPGAQHTRFEHSLGTMHVAAQLIDAVNRNSALAPAERIAVADDEARVIRAAALVHDVTHIPYGHNIEDQSGLLERHDSATRFERALAPSTAVGASLQRMGLRDEVLATLVGNELPGLPRVPPYWQELLSDTICADILDYLLRDAHYTGLNLLYDPRVLNYFMVDRESGHLFVNVAKRGVLREDILSELVRVLDARYFFSERVYYHHAKISAGAMIAQAVEGSLLDGGLAAGNLCCQTDDSLLSLLESHPPREPREAERHRNLIRDFRSRRLLKRACVFPRYANHDSQEELVRRFFAPGRHGARRELEREVEDRLVTAGRDQPIVVLYCPARQMQLTEVQTHVRFPGETSVRPLSSLADQVPRLADLERSYRDLWKLYVLASTDDRDVLSQVADIVAELLPEARNVYRP